MTETSAPEITNLDRLDFGYHWLWTYGHLIPAAIFTVCASFSLALGGPVWLNVTTIVLATWAIAGFVLVRFFVRVNQLGTLPTADFAPGEARILDLGCGAGRTSIMVALERPKCQVVALDNFSADYIAGHSETNTLANLQLAGVDNRVQVQSADMRHIPFPADSFDGVVSTAAIDHLERNDIRTTLADANRVLRADGQILLWLIVPNFWLSLIVGPLFLVHGNFASRRDWHEMLDIAGFLIDAEGTSNGLAWIQARRVREAAVPTVQEVSSRPIIPPHVLWLSGALVAGGFGLQALGLSATGLWIGGAGVVAVHLGAIFFGFATLRNWWRRRKLARPLDKV